MQGVVGDAPETETHKEGARERERESKENQDIRRNGPTLCKLWGGSVMRLRCQGGGSAPHGYIAQWLERLTADQQVPGSNPGVPFIVLIVWGGAGPYLD